MKKLQDFLGDMLHIGAVNGFKFFSLFIRGREEIIIKVINDAKEGNEENSNESTTPLASSFTASMFKQMKSQSLASSQLPHDKKALMLADCSQKLLAGKESDKVCLQPASPYGSDIYPEDKHSSIFLLAGYALYNCPYVWLRTNRERFLKMTEGRVIDGACDNPLKLQTTNLWRNEDIMVWDVIAELIDLSSYHSPLNPFTVDFTYFDGLPIAEQVLASAAMVNILQTIVTSKTKPQIYTAKVLEDLQRISKLHFEGLQQMTRVGQLSIVNEYLHKEARVHHEKIKDAKQKQEERMRQQYLHYYRTFKNHTHRNYKRHTSEVEFLGV